MWEQKEQFFKNVKELEIVGDYVFRANRSLEHLHPQHQDNNDEWPTECIHSFGNLAMISQSFNSQQSDDPVTVKFARISDQANNHALQSIKLYRMYLDAQGTPDGWTPQKWMLIKQKCLTSCPKHSPQKTWTIMLDFISDTEHFTKVLDLAAKAKRRFGLARLTSKICTWCKARWQSRSSVYCQT